MSYFRLTISYTINDRALYKSHFSLVSKYLLELLLGRNLLKSSICPRPPCYVSAQTRSVARPVMFVRPAVFRPLVRPPPLPSVSLRLLPLHSVRPLRLSRYNTPSHRPKHASARHISQERNERERSRQGRVSDKSHTDPVISNFSLSTRDFVGSLQSATVGLYSLYIEFGSFNEYVAFSYMARTSLASCSRILVF